LKGFLEIFYGTCMSTFKNQLDSWKPPLIFVRYFVTTFLQTFRKCFKMGGCTPWMVCMPTCHDFAFLGWFKALHTKGTNRNHETLEAWTQISINIKIYLGKNLKLYSSTLLYNLKSYWFRVLLWRMQTSCNSLGLSQVSSTTKDSSHPFSTKSLNTSTTPASESHFLAILVMPWEQHWFFQICQILMVFSTLPKQGLGHQPWINDLVKSPLHFEIVECDSIVDDWWGTT
jgi:hypothetical protein